MMNKLLDTVLLIYIGLPGSGKSTQAKREVKKWKHEMVWLSSDNIRIEHNYEISNEEVFDIMWERVKANAKGKKYIIYDATNLRAKNRVHLIEQYKKFCKKNGLSHHVEAVVFLQPMDVCLERNAGRSGRAVVPEDVIWRMAKQFQFPMMWEGYQYITISDTSAGEFLPIEEICMMPQDNPYHTMTLGEHLCVANEKAIMAGLSRRECAAALYHDVGKWYCKEFDKDGVAHYYGHENIGAYVLALHFIKRGKINKEYYNTICLVNYHMRPYIWEKSARARNKDKRLFGDIFYYQLENIHKCDEAAHQKGKVMLTVIISLVIWFIMLGLTFVFTYFRYYNIATIIQGASYGMLVTALFSLLLEK